jgi:hypothetical protein
MEFTDTEITQIIELFLSFSLEEAMLVEIGCQGLGEVQES